MGFKLRHWAGLILGEALLLALTGGLLGLALTFPAVGMFPASPGEYFGAFYATP